jgi:hypothetical protein
MGTIKQLLWMAAIWVTSVAALGIVTLLIRFAVGH